MYLYLTPRLHAFTLCVYVYVCLEILLYDILFDYCMLSFLLFCISILFNLIQLIHLFVFLHCIHLIRNLLYFSIY